MALFLTIQFSSGAGLSAADAILHALGLSAEGLHVRVTHVFRGKAAETKIGKMCLGKMSSVHL